MGAKFKTVKRGWLTEEQGRAFVDAARKRRPVRFERRCWEIVDQDATLTGAMTVFRLRLLPSEVCGDAP